METTKDKPMSKNYYEFTYIVNPVLEEEQYKSAVEQVNKLFIDNGAEIEEVDEWGLRKLAYPIDKKSTGYYVNMYLTAPVESIAIVERSLRIDDQFMRYLTLKFDAKMLRHRELIKNNAVPHVFEVQEKVAEG